ncbi:hypothetical protein MTO96_037552 [Rhipicephalus appendiculatus]
MAGGAMGAGGTEESLEHGADDADGHVKLKVICLGDSAVGKSKRCLYKGQGSSNIERSRSLSFVFVPASLVERFLLDAYKPHQASTYALTLLRHKTKVDGEPVIVGMCSSS